MRMVVRLTLTFQFPEGKGPQKLHWPSVSFSLLLDLGPHSKLSRTSVTLGRLAADLISQGSCPKRARAGSPQGTFPKQHPSSRQDLPWIRKSQDAHCIVFPSSASNPRASKWGWPLWVLIRSFIYQVSKFAECCKAERLWVCMCVCMRACACACACVVRTTYSNHSPFLHLILPITICLVVWNWQPAAVMETGERWTRALCILSFRENVQWGGQACNWQV